jgi:hypothetical protein
MKYILSTLTLSGVLLCAPGFAQNSSPQATDPSATQGQTQSQTTVATPVAQPPAVQPTADTATQRSPKIAPGVVIPVQLTKTVDAKKAKVGDEVMAKVTEDLKSNSGEVVVPKDTKMVGRVTEVQAHSKEQKESELAIAFDHAILKSGDVQMPMSIQAVIGPQQNDNSNAGYSGGDPGGPATGGGSQTSPMAGRAPVGGQSAPSPIPTGNTQTNAPRPVINGKTEGVIGISNLKLESASNAAQGSVLSSDKNNVKLDGGTYMLLRVN